MKAGLGMVLLWGVFIVLTLLEATAQGTRVPAVPLLTHDPYFSIWSFNDRLTDGPTRHWTGANQPLTGLVKIDGKVSRWMGGRPGDYPPVKQVALDITPTRTIYHFEQDGIGLEVRFLSPLLPSDLDVLSRPISYITIAVSALDGGQHQVEILFEASSLLALDRNTQQAVWSRSRMQGMTVVRAANFDQPVLAKSGDDVRIDWGALLLALPDQPGATAVTQRQATVEASFAAGTPLLDDDLDMPRRGDDAAVLAVGFKVDVFGTNAVSRHFMAGYDDLYSIEYMNRWLRPYWRRKGMDIGTLLQVSEREYHDLDQRARRFDDDLTADLRTVGGPAYAQLAALSYRQAIAAHKLAVDFGGQAMFFPKENFSNGCVSTVDVIYPSAPLFLLVNPELLRAQLRPLMEYTRAGRWHFPFAPHDLGTYPKANGQVYGGGERTEENQMPVEESGNMLLLFTALAKAEGKPDFAEQYWSELQKWAEYLQKEGMDPANQLSTDDFAGHLAHNSNLSIKAILALDGYATLAGQTGRMAESQKYHAIAKDMAKRWMELASDGDHFRLAFDKPGTWSQKYNLAWDRILNLNVFPPAVAKTEWNFYKSQRNVFGLPLDSRSAYTKLDWEIWTATLAPSPEEFDIIVEMLQKFIAESPSRVPLTDWYWTNDGRQVGFQARSVVGGVYMPLLARDAIWKKWSRGSRPCLSSMPAVECK